MKVSDDVLKDFARYQYAQRGNEWKAEEYNQRVKEAEQRDRRKYTRYTGDFLTWLALYQADQALYNSSRLDIPQDMQEKFAYTFWDDCKEIGSGGGGSSFGSSGSSGSSSSSFDGGGGFSGGGSSTD